MWSLASLLNGCMSAVCWTVISLIHSAHYQFAAFAYVCCIFSFVCADFRSLAGHLGSYEPRVQALCHRYKKKKKKEKCFLVLNYLPLKKEFLHFLLSNSVASIVAVSRPVTPTQRLFSLWSSSSESQIFKNKWKGNCTKWWVSEMWVLSWCNTHKHTQTYNATICQLRKMKNMINNGSGSLTDNFLSVNEPL